MAAPRAKPSARKKAMTAPAVSASWASTFLGEKRVSDPFPGHVPRALASALLRGGHRGGRGCVPPRQEAGKNKSHLPPSIYLQTPGS